MRVGLISDTHGLLRPEVFEILQGSELIVHAGDVGSPDIIPRLETMAPVVAVRGNIDKPPLKSLLPETAIAEAGGSLIYVLHDLAALDLNPAAAGFRVVLSGHTHKPRVEERDGVLYINPGSAGPRRFNLPVTVALLQVDARGRDVEIVDLQQTARDNRAK